MIRRLLHDELRNRISAGGKIVELFGARQVGKTTLVQTVLGELNLNTRYVSGDDARDARALSSRDLDELRRFVAGHQALFVDEAQRIPEIGLNLKLLHDHVPDLRIVVTGSSSLDLASKTREALTGRAWVYTLFPIAYAELAQRQPEHELRRQLEQRLRFGNYPGLLTLEAERDQRTFVQTLTDSYLYKDILEVGNIKNHAKLRDLLQLLAYQIGQEVSITELAVQLQINRETVNHYIDLLEQSHVIFRLRGFSRNLRKEVSKMAKVYFWDTGVRNALIYNFDPLDRRTDAGSLWENYAIVERRKLLSYVGEPVGYFFWRTHTGAELDFIEQRSAEPHGIEFKWGKAKLRSQKSFLDAYPRASVSLINPENAHAYFVSADLPSPPPISIK